MSNNSLPMAFYIYGTLLLIILVFMIINMMFLVRQKVKDYNLILKQENIRRENELLATRIEVHEQTLVHIAQELHDNIGQEVGLAKIILRDLESDPKDLEETRRVVSESVAILEKISTDMRLVSHSLNAYHIEDAGLIVAIERELYYLREYAKIKTTFDYPEDGLPDMDENMVLLLFRVLQECLQNIVRHAHASDTMISITLSSDSKHMEAMVQDNGVGMDLGHVRKGMGIDNMKERIKILHGSFQIASAPRQGTTTVIGLPLETIKQENNERDKNSNGR